MFTGFRETEINLFFTTLTGETGWTGTLEVVNQIGTVGTQQTRILSAVINVSFAMESFPSGQTFTLVTALLQSSTAGSVGARISVGGTRINGDITVFPCVTTAAETGIILVARFILAHSTGGAGIFATITGLFLAIDARITGRTFTAITLRLVNTGTTVVTWL